MTYCSPVSVRARLPDPAEASELPQLGTNLVLSLSVEGFDTAVLKEGAHQGDGVASGRAQSLRET
ncbi:hypothetical protein ADK90_03285 [Streptomyces sp. XY413]|nr:hypothetical protein ADK90_03285 [Streptomyces sp. XY413]